MEYDEKRALKFQDLFSMISRLRRASYILIFVTPTCSLDRYCLFFQLVQCKCFSAAKIVIKKLQTKFAYFLAKFAYNCMFLFSSSFLNLGIKSILELYFSQYSCLFLNRGIKPICEFYFPQIYLATISSWVARDASIPPYSPDCLNASLQLLHLQRVTYMWCNVCCKRWVWCSPSRACYTFWHAEYSQVLLMLIFWLELEKQTIVLFF